MTRASRLAELVERRETLVLTEADVAALLPLGECIAQQEAAFREFAAGGVEVPPRTRLRVGEAGAISIMPGYAPAAGGLGCKVLTRFTGNRARGLPTLLSTLVLLDPATGFPVACLSATHLTNARTAAAAALAVRVLRRRQAETVGVYGSGALGRLILEALTHVMAVKDVVVYSPSAANRERYAREMTERVGCPVAAAPDPAPPAERDVVVAATTAVRPVFDGRRLRPGATVVSVAGRPDVRELPPEAFRGHRLVVDSRPAALREAGDLAAAVASGELAPDAIDAELGDVLLGRARGRQHDEQICVFKSTGLAIQDLVTARAVVEAALAGGAGLRVPMQRPPA